MEHPLATACTAALASNLLLYACSFFSWGNEIIHILTTVGTLAAIIVTITCNIIRMRQDRRDRRDRRRPARDVDIDDSLGA